ncbi:MAG: DUF167 domain-containing protein [Candidatus Peribacteraceae bacterium]
MHAYQQQLQAEGSVRFFVRARPGAQSTRIMGMLEDGSVKIAIAAPPQGNRANSELLRYLARTFGVIRSQVRIVTGATAHIKLVEVRIQ